jgi:hypothetical protein
MRARLVVIPVAVLAVAFVASELLLPRQAENRVRDELARNGQVRRVKVEAFPAAKLLFGRADRVEVELATLKAGSGRLADLIDSADRTGEMQASVALLEVGPLKVRDASVAKREDGTLRGEAAVTREALAAAIPFKGVAVTPEVTEAGELVVETTAPVFGTQVAVRAALAARDGAIIVAPEGLLASFGTVTVFRDPRVRVDALGARESADGFVVTAEARLTD